MKKTVYTSLAALALVSVIGTSSITAHADALSQTTDGKVVFEENDGKEVKPVDPTDPTKPIDPKDPNTPVEPDNKENPDKGPLALVVAPKTFDFGTHKANPNGGTYAAISGKKDADGKAIDGTYYLQVSDLRDTGTQGWSVAVSQDKAILPGAEISLPAGAVKNSQGVTAGLKSEAASPITTDAKTVFSSDATSPNAGKDQSVSSWNVSDVKLKTAANTEQKGSFSNTINWTLTAAATSGASK